MTAVAERDRGEFRPIYTALVHGPQFLALSKWARALWYPVKLSLGPLGIAAMPGAIAVFGELSGLAADEVELASAELVAGGWLKIEGNVWWLRRGLEFEPQLDPKNANHVAFIRRQWGRLPNLLIRAEFAAAYRVWFLGMSQAPGMALAGPSKPPPITDPDPEPDPEGVFDRAKVREAFGTEAPTVEAFLDQQPTSIRYRWSCRVLGYLEGLDVAGGKKATPQAVGRALRDLEGDANPAKVRRFIERVMADVSNPVGAGRSIDRNGKPGTDVAAAVRRLEAKRAAR